VINTSVLDLMITEFIYSIIIDPFFVFNCFTCNKNTHS